jgi:hypothetical protein
MRRALSLLLALAWLLNGCTSWRTQEVSPASYIQSQHPGKIRLTLQDSTRLTLQSPAVVGDSIVGASGGDSALQAVPVSNVRSFEVRQTSAGKTVGLVFGIVVGAAAVLVAGWAISCGDTCWD